MYNLGDRYLLKGPWLGEQGEVIYGDNIPVCIADPKAIDPYNSVPLPEDHYWVSDESGASHWLITPDLLAAI